MSKYSFICFLARILMKSLFRIRIRGAENIPQAGPFIIAPNHISFLDPVAVGAFVPRDLHHMARDTLFDIPFLGRFLRICQAFPVRRDRLHPRTMKRALAVLSSGKGLLLFPEGTRSISGKLLKGGPGLGMLASIAAAPVIPTLVAGTEKALPVDAHWIRLEKIQVQFGKPVFPAPVEKNSNRRQTYQALTDEVMKRIRDLQNQRGRDTL